MPLKFIAFLILIVATVSAAQAQHRKTDPKTHKKGFYDRKGQVLVPFEYDELPREWDSIMVAKKGPFLGLIGGQGEIILPFEYQEVRLHLQRGGFSLVKKKALSWGIANSRGKFVLPMQFESVAVIDRNLLSARMAGETMVQLYDGQGTPLYKLPGKTVEPGFNGKTLKILGLDKKSRYTDLQGRPIFPETMPNARWTDGDVIISGSYGNYGLLNFRGDTILPLRHQSVQPALPGQFLVVTTDHKHGVVDKQGHTVIPFDKWQIFPKEKFYRVEDWSHQSGLFASDGQAILPKEFIIREPEVALLYKDEPDAQPQRYLVVTNGKAPYLKGIYSAVDAAVILPIEYNEIWYLSEKHPLIAAKERDLPPNRAEMAFDLSGKPLLSSFYHDLWHTKHPRMLLANRGDGLWGFLNLDGDTAHTEFLFRYLNELQPGIYTAMHEDSSFVLLNAEGKLLYKGRLTGVVRPNEEKKRLFENMPGASGVLVVVAPRPSGGWIGINDEGTEFFLDESVATPITALANPVQKTPPPVIEPPAVQHIDTPKRPSKKEGKAVPNSNEVEEVAELITMEVPPVEEKTWEPEQVDTPPQFPGGPDSAAVFFQRRLKPCEIMLQTNDERYWHTKLGIVVKEDGTFYNVQSWSPFGNACNRDVEQVARQMPRWTPAIKDGKAVRCRCFLMVKHREK